MASRVEQPTERIVQRSHHSPMFGCPRFGFDLGDGSREHLAEIGDASRVKVARCGLLRGWDGISPGHSTTTASPER
jgi:hypothetical protein